LKDTKQRLTKRIDDVQRESESELDKLKEELRSAKRDIREKAKKFELEKENLEK
jgi:gas vesicle protein